MGKRLYIVIVLSIMAFANFACTGSEKNQTITNLKVEALQTPLAVDNPTPDFGWQMQSDVIGIKQTG